MEIRIAEFIYIPVDVLYSDLHPALLRTYCQILGLTAGGKPGEKMQALTLSELVVTFALLSAGIRGCSAPTLRRHLNRLQEEGLVTWSKEAGGTLAVWPLEPHSTGQ